jgi:maleamate amidohydrolase
MVERVWDPYLTEQDKQHLAASGHIPKGFGQRPAVLLIDLYRWVFGDRPLPLMEAIKEWPGSCGLAAWESLPYLQSLLSNARDVGIPIVHVTGLSDSESGVLGWANARNREAKTGYLGDSANRVRSSDMFNIIDEVAPVRGEAFMRKASPSPFYNTPLLAHLSQLGVDTLIVAGESTSGCVRASVVDACANRYKVVVVEECVFDRHEATHALNLFDMHYKYADVLSHAEVVDWMHEWQPPAGYRM